ncbi:MAG TPA: hypothetical protein VKB35_10185 [Ktedonobacteraceae bacterium]|nr:hypothetical protein [Ktedonobacteraceae bacterium]
MINEAVSPPRKDNLYSYEIVETLQDIVSAAERISATGMEQVALVTIRLFYGNEEKSSKGRLTSADHSARYLLGSLRTLVRKTDSVLLLKHTMYFLLRGATMQGGEIVQNRLWEALLWRVHNLTENDASRPQGIVVGHSAYPIPHATIYDFIEAASKPGLRLDSQPEKILNEADAQDGQQAEDETGEELPVLARRLGIPYLRLLPRKLPRAVQHLVNPKLAQELRCYPLGRERNMLTVAMLNPEDRSALERLEQETGLFIFPVLTHPHALQVALEQLI